mmetsp:Transcript_76907/g.222294  ORF Transcript_76907/g.222294 Transcript_76907/m.222294 type:complete len:279 (+) Transcript_76907:578-1414(+)
MWPRRPSSTPWKHKWQPWKLSSPLWGVPLPRQGFLRCCRQSRRRTVPSMHREAPLSSPLCLDFQRPQAVEGSVEGAPVEAASTKASSARAKASQPPALPPGWPLDCEACSPPCGRAPIRLLRHRRKRRALRRCAKQSVTPATPRAAYTPMPWLNQQASKLCQHRSRTTWTTRIPGRGRPQCVRPRRCRRLSGHRKRPQSRPRQPRGDGGGRTPLPRHQSTPPKSRGRRGRALAGRIAMVMAAASPPAGSLYASVTKVGSGWHATCRHAPRIATAMGSA